MWTVHLDTFAGDGAAIVISSIDESGGGVSSHARRLGGAGLESPRYRTETHEAGPPTTLPLPRSVRKIDRSVLRTRVVLQSGRYGDVSISGCRSIPRSIFHQQSRLECSEFRCNGAWDTMFPVKGRGDSQAALR